MGGFTRGTSTVTWLAAIVVAALLGASLGVGALVARPQWFASLIAQTEEESSPEETAVEQPELSGQLAPLQGVEDIAESVGPSVVGVSSQVAVEDWMRGPQEIPGGMGSGVVIDEQGHVLTNAHVVMDAREVQVSLDEERQVNAEVVGTDAPTDLAVLRIADEDLPAAPLGDSDDLAVGELAVAIGNPLGMELQRTVTAGIVSALDRSIQGEDGAILENLIQTDASINPGNSGGPLLNARGEVIGINTAKVQQAEGIGFAIPINQAKPIVDELVQQGYVARPWLGIVGVTLQPAQARQYELAVERGVIVAEVQARSAAEEAGLQRGDIITEIGGTAISSIEELTAWLDEADIGDEVELVWNRDGAQMSATVTLGERPQT